VPILEELKEILICDLMTKPQFAQLKSWIRSLLYKWLDLLYKFESAKAKRNDNLLSEIQSQGLLLLKDKQTLKGAWDKGIRSLLMYKSVTESPLIKFDSLLLLLDVLCGQSSFRYAE
jgi:hypothetical protein